MMTNIETTIQPRSLAQMQHRATSYEVVATNNGQETRLAFTERKTKSASLMIAQKNGGAILAMKAVCYYRVSTARQGASGLGLEGQKMAVSSYLQGAAPAAEYTEIESGRNDARPELLKALAHCQRAGAVLVVAKLDRLARSVRFLLALRDAEIPFRAADSPDANELTINILIAVAEAESKSISERTSRAIQAKIARGETWGRPNAGKALQGHQRAGAMASAKVRAKTANRKAEAWRPLIDEMRVEGLGNCAMARTLNTRGEWTSQGTAWTATAIRRLRARLDAMVPAVGIMHLTQN